MQSGPEHALQGLGIQPSRHENSSAFRCWIAGNIAAGAGLPAARQVWAVPAHREGHAHGGRALRQPVPRPRCPVPGEDPAPASSSAADLRHSKVCGIVASLVGALTRQAPHHATAQACRLASSTTRSLSRMTMLLPAFECINSDVSYAQVYHELVVLEQIHKHPEFCPGASLEALTRPPLVRH